MDTTRVALNELPFLPRWLGQPVYPGGFPVPNDSFSVETGEPGVSRSLRERITEYYQKAIDDGGELTTSPGIAEEDFQVLRQWVIYYVHAPVFSLPDELLSRSLAMANWSELREFLMDALDAGLDVF